MHRKLDPDQIANFVAQLEFALVRRACRNATGISERTL